MSARNAAERLQLELSTLRYLGRAPVALGIAVRLRSGFSQSWTNGRGRQTYLDSLSSSDHLTEVDSRERTVKGDFSIRPSVAVGRVRDATGVYLARVVEARLRAEGALSRALTRGARRTLADLLTLRAAYADVRERPAKTLWGEIERICREDGALRGDAVDAHASIRAGEPLLGPQARGSASDGLPVAVVFRQRGARVSAFVDATGGRSSRFSEIGSRVEETVDGARLPVVLTRETGHEVYSSNGGSAGGQFEWHCPIGMRLQIDAVSEFSVPIRSRDEGVSATTSLSATWVMTDRWRVDARLGQAREWSTDSRSGLTEVDYWSTSMDASIHWELEDQVTLLLGARETQDHVRVMFPSYDIPRFAHRRRVFVGLTYRFAGRFVAPGFPQLSERMPPPAGF